MPSRIKIYALLALPGLIALAPVLFFGQVFADGDAVQQLYPSFQFLQDAMRTGDTVVWNPHVLTGFVTAASLMGGLLSWFHQLVLQVLSIAAAYGFLTFFYFTLTAIFTFELVVALGLSPTAAVFAGLVAPWVSAYFAWAGNMTMTPSFFLLPALLYFGLKFSRRPWGSNLVMVLAGGILIGTALHAAHIQTATQAIATAMVWALFLDIRNRKLRALPMLLLTLVVAAVVAWPQYRLFLFAKDLSARVLQGISMSEAQGGALVFGDPLSFLFPDISLPKGISQPGILYVGAVPLFLLALAFGRKKSAEFKFFAGVLAFTTLASIKYSPVLYLVHRLPLFSSFRGLSRLMYVALFALVMLAAYGLEQLHARNVFTRWRQIFFRWVWRGALAMLAGFVLWSLAWNPVRGFIREQALQYFTAHYPASELTLPRAHYEQVIDQLIGNIGRGTTLPNLPVTVAVVSLVVAAALFQYRDKFSSRQLAVGLVAISAMNLATVNAARINTVPFADLQSPPQSVSYLRAHAASDFRVFTVFAGFTAFDRLDTPYGYHPRENVELLKNILSPNLGMLYGIDSLDSYDNLMDERSSRVLGYLGSDRSLDQEGKLTEQPVSFEEKLKIFLQRLPLLSQYNVRYVVSAYPLEHPQLKEVLRWEVTVHRIPLYLYENVAARPRYALVGDPVMKNVLPGRESWAANLEAAQQGKTVIECDACAPGELGSGTVTLQKKSNAAYEFLVTAASSQYFVFGQNFLPGWRATVDGKPVTILRANYINQAIAVPAGTHTVVFTFAPLK
ncbi:MAG: hypothetical protein PHI63_03125 [Patescibacteria group bacterium]|nr:hypothetical protein [Patescibacteria group bacterium]